MDDEEKKNNTDEPFDLDDKKSDASDSKTDDTKSIESKQANSKNEKKNDDEETAAITRKVIFALCYLWGILFFLPLIMYKDDAEAKLHANEGLVLLLISVVANGILGAFTGAFMGNPVGTVFSILLAIANVLIFILGILGIVNVVTDSGKSLPFIGSIKIIK